MTVQADRSSQYEGRVRRVTTGSGAAPDFRAMVIEPPAEEPVPVEPVVSGWAGLVTAGRTGPAEGEVPAVPEVPVDPVPTLESVFGDNPWVANPTGQGPLGTYSFNPIYFATPQTAEKVAELLGGTVIQQNALCSAPNSPFQQQQANYMVKLPSGRVTNPGLVAAYFQRGYPQSTIDRLLSIERNEAA
jgi:hypothetical protein